MRIFISTPAPNHEAANRLHHHFEDLGHDVVSSWYLDTEIGYHKDPERLSMDAARDIAQLSLADIFVQISNRELLSGSHGGTMAELGAALILRCVVFLIGERSCIFHYHPVVKVVESEKSMLLVIEEMYKNG